MRKCMPSSEGGSGRWRFEGLRAECTCFLQDGFIVSIATVGKPARREQAGTVRLPSDRPYPPVAALPGARRTAPGATSAVHLPDVSFHVKIRGPRSRRPFAAPGASGAISSWCRNCRRLPPSGQAHIGDRRGWGGGVGGLCAAGGGSARCSPQGGGGSGGEDCNVCSAHRLSRCYKHLRLVVNMHRTNRRSAQSCLPPASHARLPSHGWVLCAGLAQRPRQKPRSALPPRERTLLTLRCRACVVLGSASVASWDRSCGGGWRG